MHHEAPQHAIGRIHDVSDLYIHSNRTWYENTWNSRSLDCLRAQLTCTLLVVRRRIPRLEFRHNILTDAQEAIETELERLELERQLEQLQSGS